VQQLRQALDAAAAEKQALEARVNDAESRAGAGSDATAAAERGAIEARDKLATAERIARETGDKLAATEGALRDAGDKLAAADARANAAEARANELAAQHAQSAGAEAAAAQARIAQLEKDIAVAADRATNAEDQLAARDADLADARRRVEDAAGQAEELRSLRAAADEAEGLRDRIGTLERDAAAHERAAAATDLLREQLQTVTIERDQLKDAGTQAEDERRRRRDAEEQLMELQDKVGALEKAAAAAPANGAPAHAAPTPAIGEHVQVLQDSLSSLRSSMRAASDETAVMDQTEPVQIVSNALSQAAEEIERARDALRALADLAGTAS
jgi:chromosome segregation ATPase